jgi:hypothetical protein
MPRTTQDIIDQADKLAKQFEDHAGRIEHPRCIIAAPRPRGISASSGVGAETCRSRAGSSKGRTELGSHRGHAREVR